MEQCLHVLHSIIIMHAEQLVVKKKTVSYQMIGHTLSSDRNKKPLTTTTPMML